MKKYILLIIASLAACMAMAAGNAEIRFDSVKFDLGTIKASGGPVTATYNFTNVGTTPLVIVNVTNGGCGCTTPSYPKQPIAPGKKGTVLIHFNPQGRRGELNRNVRVKTNGKPSRTELYFTGVIVP